LKNGVLIRSIARRGSSKKKVEKGGTIQVLASGGEGGLSGKNLLKGLRSTPLSALLGTIPLVDRHELYLRG